MKLLYLAHTVPFPPNKGEKIRAYQQLRVLTREHEVHLACFARDAADVESAQPLLEICASMYAETRNFHSSLVEAGLRFIAGGSLNMAFYQSASMRAYIRTLGETIQFDAVLAYALPMAPYAPKNLPIILDMQDVDSQKWFEYSAMRRPQILFRLEADRLQAQETTWTSKVQCTFLTSRQETSLLRSSCPDSRIECIENGVDSDYFDPKVMQPDPGLATRRYVVFVGTMDYFPNVDGACWFAREVFPDLRRANPTLEFLIVGNRPSHAVRDLMSLPGVTVVGGVPDVRPYVSQALAVVVPLRLARGIQNKVLEALAMGRQVFVTPAVGRTFGGELPKGVVECASEVEFSARIQPALSSFPEPDSEIRKSAVRRFTWKDNLGILLRELRATETLDLHTPLEVQTCPN